MNIIPERLELERLFKASPKRVFEAFASYDGMKQWFGPGACHVVAGELDFQIGGHYRLRVLTENDGEVEVVGTYQTIDHPSKLTFTWKWQGNPTFQASESIVDLSFQPHAEGTLLRLRQTGIQDDESRANHGHGWNGAFDKLENLFTKPSQ